MHQGFRRHRDKMFHASIGLFSRMLLKRVTGSGERARETGKWKWEQSREWEIKLLIGLWSKLGFVPIFHFPFPVLVSRSSFSVPRSPFPVPRLSNTPLFPGIHSSRPPDSREKRSLVVGKTRWQADVKLQRLYEETDVNSFCERSVLRKY